MAFVVSETTEQEKLEDTLSDSIAEAENLYGENQTEEALALYLVILEKAKSNNNYSQLILCSDRISEIFTKIQNYEKAIIYSKNTLKYSTLTKDTIKIIDANLKLSSLHYKLFISNKDVNNKSLDSMNYYNVICSNLLDEPNKYKKQRAIHYSSQAISALVNKNYNGAQFYIKKALKINQEIKDTIGQVINLNTLAGNNLKTNNFESAKKQYEKALYLIKNSSSERKSSLQRMINSNLAWAYYKTENSKAYEHLDTANRIADSLRSAEFDAIITEIEAKHNVDIIKQNAERTRIIETQKKKRFQGYTIGLSICLLVIIFIFYTYTVNSKLKHENKDLLFLKTKLIKEKEIEQLESRTRIKILNATLDGKETERKQIAETLHDSVSALLSAANLHLQASKNKFKGETPIEIDKTQKIIDEASGKIRNLSHELISSVLLKFGLSYAIQDFCEKYSNSELTIDCSVENIQRYEENFEIKINNIIEELVNNLIKHSNASQGYVNLMEYKKYLYVEIQDNGQGFDTSKKLKSEGIGLHQIKARIHMMKGSFKITSKVKEGTKIEFTVPITYRS